MVRYLGQKLFNWPAAILIIGWALVGNAFYVFDLQGWVSTFRRALPEAPLIWWPEMSFPGFTLVLAPPLVGALSLWIVPAMDYSVRLSATLITLGAALFIAGVVWDSGAGVALYADRVVHRGLGFGRSLETELLSDIRRVETACVVTRGRYGRLSISPVYEVVFDDETGIDIWRGHGVASTPRVEQLEHVRMVDRAARRAGAVRARTRKPDGSLVGTPGCIPRLANRLAVPAEQIQELFAVDQSQLRPGEIATAAEP